jgi:uncharacterized protein (TIGR03086 family)
MTPESDRYRRLSAAFVAKARQVPPDRWASPSPCESWTALDVIRHVVDAHAIFERLVGRTLEVPVAFDDDPVGALTATVAVVQGELDDPALAGAEYEGMFGTATFAASVDRFVCFDLVVHGWDLARAVGLDDTIDPGELDRLSAAVEGFGDAMRTTGSFGPVLEVGADADAQTRLLAQLGRQAAPA